MAADFDYSFPSCPQYVAPIRNSERIGNSLVKINNNFANLQSAYCDLYDKAFSIVHVRTFFYYGPNSSADPTSGMQDNKASYPSKTTVESFVNSSSQLNVPAISRAGDVAYVIYQKTGFYSRSASKTYSGTLAVYTGSNIASEQYKYVGYTQDNANQGKAPDTYNVFSPVFVIWKLTAQNQNASTLTYTVDSGFPKFTQAETLANSNWNKPKLWTTYQL
jgi:hypothetical protein